ncbi:MAG: PfkB family carbohydrate kinase, partial [Anaerolineales bacterium]|nr:PfkB family carbohydrate kinase [Anaerolineales bacterium]
MSARDQPLRIACIGEAMIELSFPSGEIDAPQIGFSGDTLNTAIYLKRAIGDAAEVAFISALCSDRFSDRMLDFMTAEGLQTDAITRHSERLPGLYAIETDENGERYFNYWRENSAARLMFEA